MKPSLVPALGTGLLLFSSPVGAQVASYSETTGLTFLTGTQTGVASSEQSVPSGAYTQYTTQITLTDADQGTVISTLTEYIPTSSRAESSSESTSTSSSNSRSESGSISSFASTTFASNTTATSTSSTPTNTRPCNGHVEFCKRKYSNITMVGAHNSPFVRPGNSASNQALDVTTQLNDGVRFLQAQIQWPTNGSQPHFCHTSCDILDAGPITEWLGKVKNWVRDHPYDVVTILLGNGNYSSPSLYAPYIEKTGITQYAYEAPYLPMHLDDWPTLEYMILRGKRIVMFMDYEANQKKYPYLLDEFSQVWETPYDPTNDNFPCHVQRPPNLSKKDAKDRMYIHNHNLNADFNVFGIELLVPAVSVLNTTNNITGHGSVGLAANNCRSDWGRAPNVLNVDYYNYGGFPGSVMEAAARVNNVTYNRDSCCGTVSGAAQLFGGAVIGSVLAAAGMAAFLTL